MPDENILKKVTTEDLREFGMIPEFLGRLPVVFALQAMTEEMLKKVLTQPKNAIIKQYQKLLALDEVNLVFDDRTQCSGSCLLLNRFFGDRRDCLVIKDKIYLV